MTEGANCRIACHLDRFVGRRYSTDPKRTAIGCLGMQSSFGMKIGLAGTGKPTDCADAHRAPDQMWMNMSRLVLRAGRFSLPCSPRAPPAFRRACPTRIFVPAGHFALADGDNGVVHRFPNFGPHFLGYRARSCCGSGPHAREIICFSLIFRTRHLSGEAQRPTTTHCWPGYGHTRGAGDKARLASSPSGADIQDSRCVVAALGRLRVPRTRAVLSGGLEGHCVDCRSGEDLFRGRSSLGAAAIAAIAGRLACFLNRVL